MISHLNGLTVHTKIWLEKNGKPVFGKGRARLLRAVSSEGSISKASKRMNISFRRAWSHLDDSEHNFGIPLLEKHKGGAGGGNSVLTEDARELVTLYEKLNEEIGRFAEKRFSELTGSETR